MIISGRTGGDTSAKSFYFSPWRIEARSDTGVAARHNVGLPPPDGSIRLFFLPRLSFSRTKKKDGVREWHRFNRDAGGPRILTPSPIGYCESFPRYFKTIDICRYISYNINVATEWRCKH